MCGSVKLYFKTLNLEIRLFNLTLVIMLAIQLTVRDRGPRIWGHGAAARVALCLEPALLISHGLSGK
jgi:hypothetical protein